MDQVRLLGVDSPVISPETPLSVRAQALPSGARVRVALRGVLAAAGLDERKLDVSFVGHVLSPEHLSVAIDPASVARWGRATFEGELVVDCESRALRACHGVLPRVRFDVAPQAERRAQQLRYAVDRLLPRLGLQISHADSAAHGLRVAKVAVHSFASRAGLRAGDTILRSNGVRLHAVADLAPGPSADTLVLGVRRASGRLLTLHVALADAPPLSDPRVLGLCLVACPLLLFALVRLGAPAPATIMPLVAARSGGLWRGAGWTFGFGAVLSLALGAFSALSASAFDPFIVLLLHLAGVLALRGFRVEGVGHFVADVLGLWGGALSVAAVSGTRAWPILLRDQGAAPWAWNALARLPLSVALVLCVVSAARLHAAAAEVAGPRLTARVCERVLRAGLATLCAGLFFGGVYLPKAAGVVALAVGGGLAALKSLGCYVLLEMLDGDALARSRAALWSVLVAVTAVWLRLSPSRDFELSWGSGACVLVAFAAAAALLSARATGAHPDRSDRNRARAAVRSARKPPKAAARSRSADGVTAASASRQAAASKPVARRGSAKRPARGLAQSGS